MFYLDYLQHCTQFSGYDGNPTARGLVGILIRQGPAQFRDRIFYRSNEGTGDASMKANFKVKHDSDSYPHWNEHNHIVLEPLWDGLSAGEYHLHA